MTQTQVEIIKQALLCIEEEKIEQFNSKPMVEPQYTEKYNAAIARLKKDQREKESSSLNLTYRQRIALLIATILITALTVTACANAEAIKNFVVEIIDHYARLTLPSQTIQFISCEVTYIPEGYTLEEEMIVDDVITKKTWANSESKITYVQCITNANHTIDKDCEKIYIDNQEIYLTQSEYSYCLTWVNDYGSFNLICSVSIPWEEVEAIFRSITLTENVK